MGTVLLYEDVAGLEPGANGIRSTCFVAITRQLIHGGGYLTDCTGNNVSLRGDERLKANTGKVDRFWRVERLFSHRRLKGNASLSSVTLMNAVVPDGEF